MTTSSLAVRHSTRKSQRSALEHTYRSLAKLAPSEEERWELVDLANTYRPRTLDMRGADH